MFKPILKLPKITSALATTGTASTAVCDIQPGPRFHNIVITGNAGTSKMMTDLIGDIRVIANDEVIRLFSAAELNAKNVLYGPQYAAVSGNVAATAFALPLFFAEPWRKDTYTGDALAFNTRNLRNFRIEVDFKSTTLSAHTAIAMTAEADYAPLAADAPGPMGLIVKHFRTSLNLASGWNDIGTLPRRGAYQELNFPTATVVTDVEIKIGSRTAYQATLAEMRARAIHRDMEPIYRAATSPAVTTIGGTDHAATRAMTDIIFDGDDKPNSSLVPDPGEDFIVRVNCSGALTGNLLYSILEPL